METKTLTTIHLTASEGTLFTQADPDTPDNRRTYNRELYCAADTPESDPAYWREVPEDEAMAAMVAQVEKAFEEPDNTETI